MRYKTKRCSRCGETKRTNAFATNKSAKDGLASVCRGCLRVRYAESKARHFGPLPKQPAALRRELERRIALVRAEKAAAQAQALALKAQLLEAENAEDEDPWLSLGRSE